MARSCRLPPLPHRRRLPRPWRVLGQAARCTLLAALAALALALPLLQGAAVAASGGAHPAPLMRKVPGSSPEQTIRRFLELTGEAEEGILGAIRQGMAEPGLFFPASVHHRVDEAVDKLQQATEAMDLSQVPVSLRPMTGVASLLMLRSLLLYDLDQHPGLVIPNEQQVREKNIQLWTIPDSTISLVALKSQPAGSGNSQPDSQPCSQCSPGDFLFTAQTIANVPSEFEAIFASNSISARRYRILLYAYWSQIPGGAIPPKPFLKLPSDVTRVLLLPMAGQSLIQWLLLIPTTLLGLTALAWWLLKLKAWLRRHCGAEGPWIHLLRAFGLVPPLLLVWGWEWFSINWINLIGSREAAVLVGSQLTSGLLLVLFTYFLAEAIGQLLAHQRRPGTRGWQHLVRRKGSGQILTLARTFGLVAALMVALRTGQQLGITSVTLLALSSVPALALSLGTQQLIRDIADGFSLLLDGQIKPGDRCAIGTQKSGVVNGQILTLGMRSIRMEQDDGAIVSIPNSQVADSVLTTLGPRKQKTLELATALPDRQPQVLQQVLERAREVVAAEPALENPAVSLEAANPEMLLRLKAPWKEGITSEEHDRIQEALLLRLLAVVEGCSSGTLT